MQPALELAGEQAVHLEVVLFYRRANPLEQARVDSLDEAARAGREPWASGLRSVVITPYPLPDDGWRSELGSRSASFFSSDDDEFIAVNSEVDPNGAIASSLYILARVFGVPIINARPSAWSEDHLIPSRQRVLSAVAETLSTHSGGLTADASSQNTPRPSAEIDLFVRPTAAGAIAPTAALDELLARRHAGSGELFSLCAARLAAAGELILAQQLSRLLRRVARGEVATPTGATDRAANLDRAVALTHGAFRPPGAEPNGTGAADDLYRLAAAAWLSELNDGDLETATRGDDHAPWIKLLVTHAPSWTSSDDQTPPTDRSFAPATPTSASLVSLKDDLDRYGVEADDALGPAQRLLTVFRIATALAGSPAGERHLVVPYRESASNTFRVAIWPPANEVQREIEDRIGFELGFSGAYREKRHDLGNSFGKTGLSLGATTDG
ncbi:hypothetical protein SAMN05892883_2808 [Jatrophihabitans sp. GAS493]|uniref:hypothetical protein n=1 Tax=Jatrophihabitans sp. GAS493 TaxID=1907575 RepID=UPI000BBF9C91|nr:hypothetical protein [Jatrophihabitans sp. GAS493]SOD73516.1 hypothetical protein SAMN05892883_2808 [Jatrophihabitans sp. GAS493]